MGTFSDAKRDAKDFAVLVNEDTDVDTRYGGTKPSYIKKLNQLAANFNLTPAFDFADGFIIQTRNQAGLGADGNYWIYNGALPFEVTAGVVPSEPDYKKVTFSEAQNVTLSTGQSVQGFADSLALKIFQSPTDGDLTEIQTRTVEGGEVYEVRKTSDDSLATIYSNATGTTEIVQNGTANVSDSAGAVEFYISDGDYYVEAGALSSNFSTLSVGDEAFKAVGSTTDRSLEVRAADIINALDYGLTNDGVDCTTANAEMINGNAGRSIYYPDGEYNITEYPTGIDDVHLTGSPRIVWTDKKMPTASKVFAGGQDIAIVSGVLRYYRAGFSEGVTADGWYMLQDAGQNHYASLIGPVRASGGISAIVDLQIEDFGLNRSEWTPSGFVCGADETYAAQGITFGASVRTDFFTINATGNLPRSGYVTYDGTYPTGSFSMAGMTGLSFEWVQGTAPNAYLKITRTSEKRLGYSANSYSDLTITPRSEQGSGLMMTNPDLQSGTEYRYRFFSAPEGLGFSEVQDPTGLQFYVTDRGQSPELWNFANPEDLGAAEGGSGNIWCVGVFTRRYPNE